MTLRHPHMRTAYARAHTHFAKPIPDHRYHDKSSAALLYIVKDVGEAAQAMRGLNTEAGCKYLDQVNDACTVLRYRRMLAAQLTPINSGE
jgi:hypothetical protein